MRRKNTPMKVVDKFTNKKQVSKETPSSTKRFKNSKKVKKFVYRKVKNVSKPWKKPNQYSHLILQIKPCSVVLTRCDEKALVHEKPSFPSQNSKKVISMTLRCKSNSRTYKNFGLVSSKTSDVRKPSSKLSNIISKILKNKKIKVVKAFSKQKLEKKFVKIKQTGNQKHVRFAVPKSTKKLQFNKITKLKPAALVLNKGNKEKSGDITYCNFEHLIHNYARPENPCGFNEYTEDTSCIPSFTKGTQQSIQECNEEFPLSKVCKVCGAWFNISSFLMENQGALVQRKYSSCNLEEDPNEFTRTSYVLRPEQFDSITLCLSASTPIPYQLETRNYIHCSKCPMMYLKIENLQSHKRVHHFVCNKSSICKYCFQVFHSKWGVIRHMQRLHTQEALLEENCVTSPQAFVMNELYVYSRPFENVLRAPRKPSKFVVNVPNITNAFLGTKVTMFSHSTYSSYLVNLGDGSNECVTMQPHEETECDNEWLSYINTCHNHNYPADEHNYAFIPPTLMNNITNTGETENALGNCTVEENTVNSLVLSEISSHFLDDGVPSKNFSSDISHIEEITEKASVAEQEDFCISLSPDIVMYISHDEDQATLNDLNQLPQRAATEPSYPLKSYSREKHGLHTRTVTAVQNNTFQRDHLKIPNILEDKLKVQSVGKNIEPLSLHTAILSTREKEVKETGKSAFQSLYSNKLNSESKLENNCSIESGYAFRCKPCQQIFSNKEIFTKHMLHHVRWRCSVCRMVFKSNSCYQEHTLKVHGKPTLKGTGGQKVNKPKDSLVFKTIQDGTSFLLLDSKISSLQKTSLNKCSTSFRSSIPSDSLGSRLSDNVPVQKALELNTTLSDNLDKDLKNITGRLLSSSETISNLRKISSNQCSTSSRSSVSSDNFKSRLSNIVHVQKSLELDTTPSDNSKKALKNVGLLSSSKDFSNLQKTSLDECSTSLRSSISSDNFGSRLSDVVSVQKAFELDNTLSDNPDKILKIVTASLLSSSEKSQATPKDKYYPKKDFVSVIKVSKNAFVDNVKENDEKNIKRATACLVPSSVKDVSKSVQNHQTYEYVQSKSTNTSAVSCSSLENTSQNERSCDQVISACLGNDGHYHCNLCSSSFVNLLTFQEHRRVKHGIVGRIKCPSCPAVFNHRSEFRIHFKLHSDDSAIICATCSWTFTDKSNFLSHYRVQHIKPWTHRFRKHLCVFSSKPYSCNNKDMILYKCKFCEISYLRHTVK